MRVAAATGVLLAALAAAGCKGKAAKPLSGAELRQLVLQQSDLPSKLQEFSDARESRSEQSPVLRGDAHRFDRQSGWIVRFRRRGNPKAKGPLTVVAVVEMFARPSGAAHFLDDTRRYDKLAGPSTGLKAVDVPKLGDETHATTSKRAPKGSIRYVSVAWREGRFVGGVFVSGFAQNVNVDDAVALAFGDIYRVALVILALGWCLVWTLRRPRPSAAAEPGPTEPASFEPGVMEAAA
jgi:hypothetical protein